MFQQFGIPQLPVLHLTISGLTLTLTQQGTKSRKLKLGRLHFV